MCGFSYFASTNGTPKGDIRHNIKSRLNCHRRNAYFTFHPLLQRYEQSTIGTLDILKEGQTFLDKTSSHLSLPFSKIKPLQNKEKMPRTSKRMELIQGLKVLAIYHELEESDDKDFGNKLLSALQGTVSLIQSTEECTVWKGSTSARRHERSTADESFPRGIPFHFGMHRIPYSFYQQLSEWAASSDVSNRDYPMAFREMWQRGFSNGYGQQVRHWKRISSQVYRKGYRSLRDKYLTWYSGEEKPSNLESSRESVFPCCVGFLSTEWP